MSKTLFDTLYMKKTTKFLINLSILTLVIMPAFSLAQKADPGTGLIPCGNEFKGPNGELTGDIPHPCTFTDFMTLVNKVIKFALFDMVVPIAAIMFAYAGFLLVTSGGSSEARTKAKTIFTNVALGLIIAVAAWLIIRTILLTLGYPGDWIGF